MHSFSLQEIQQTRRMLELEKLDIRCMTIGVNLLDCADRSLSRTADNIYRKVTRTISRLVPVCDEVEGLLGIPIVNKRASVTPISLVASPAVAAGERDLSVLAEALDRAAKDCGIDFLGGYSALVHKGSTPADHALLESIPEGIGRTERVCCSVNVATTRAGINVDAVAQMGRILRRLAERTAAQGGIGCAKLVTFANIPEDNPFMAGAMHGIGEKDAVVNCGVSGPGVVAAMLSQLGDDVDLGTVAERIKGVAFKVTRLGQLALSMVAERLELPAGVVDLSLAPTPNVGDSVAEILEAMGVELAGTHGTTMALALLTDAVKKGGAMAAHAVGGLSGAFIPVSEDLAMDEAVQRGALSLDKLEAMSAVCSVGLDMVVVPGDTPAETLSATIGDEIAIGVVNHKTTAVRIIPAPGKKAGEMVEFGGLLGRATVMPVNAFSSARLIRRGGQVPAPIHSMRN